MNPELLGNGLWLLLASQGSLEGLWQVPWGGQSLTGPLEWWASPRLDGGWW